MHALKVRNPDIWKELEDGNISVTKNDMYFESNGTDHACEQLKKLTKVHYGLIGIANNPSARQCFFTAAPELSNLAREFTSQFSTGKSSAVDHPELSPAAVKRNHEAVIKIKAAILRHDNPFAMEGQALCK